MPRDVYRRLLPLPLLGLFALVGCEADPTYPAAEEPCRHQVQVRVTEFLDGDTADVEFLGDREGEIDRIRLNGVDTAEVDHDNESASECWALEAWAAGILGYG